MAICPNYDFEAVEEHRQFQEEWKPIYQLFIDNVKNVEQFFVRYDYFEKRMRVLFTTDPDTANKCAWFHNPEALFIHKGNHDFAITVCPQILDKKTMGWCGYHEVDRPTDTPPLTTLTPPPQTLTE